MAFTAVSTCQGITLQWGDHIIGVTGMQYSRSAAGEIDITSMSSTIYPDSSNTSRALVRKSIDYSVVDMGELSCEFFGTGSLDETHIGCLKDLSVVGLASTDGGDVRTLTAIKAYLTQVSTQIVAGDLVKGSCTFKLSDEVVV